MAEENVIQTNIVAKSDMSPLIADLNRVTSSLALLQERLNSTNKGLATQAAAINRTFAETLRSTGQFSTHFVSLSSDVDKFGTQLDKGQLKLSQFFRVYGDHAKTSGGLIRDLAKQQVQLQNAILQPLGRNAEGLMQYNVHIPRGLDLTKNKMAVMRQEMQILNKVVQEGAGQLINWGKNTQWAGRQLTVGLTVPMAAFGKAAADAFKAADEQLVRLTKVYGGLSATSSAELAKVRKDVTETAAELAKSYGASFKDTLALAGDIAATGKQGNELIGSIQETTRLSVLGEVDRQDAMKATLAIQTAFKQNTQELSESINFLNAVENQTSTTLNDLVEAIPKAGPVIKGLGGDIEDLALYLTAMREGGINASEGANALKSGLASLINPTKVATAMFKGFGIDIKNIVTSNAGNLTKTILDLQTALDTLDPLQKQQALEQLFGKFQFARMNALFSNLGKQGSQTLQVLDLMKASSQDLASIAGRELTQVTESASGKYKRAVEGLKADLAGIGDQFLKINTTLINVVDSVIKFVDKLPQPLKQALAFMGMLTATAGPLIMLAGVLGNFFGYIIKGVYHFKALFKGAEGWKLLTPEILAANKAGDMAEKTFYDDARAAAILKQALDGLVASYTKLEAKAHSAAVATNPTITTVAGSHVIGGRQVNPTSPYTGEKDTRAFSHMKPVATMTDDEKGGQTFFGVVPGSEAVNQKIGANPQVYMEDDLPKIAGVTAVKGVSTGVVAEEAGKWHAMTAALAMQSQSEIKALKREVGATGLVTTELSTSYQALLPKMTELTRLAANESALIVAQLEAGKLTVDQARAKIIALNAQIERMMVQTATETAAGMGRTLDVTKVPLLNQPVVDPNTGKSNMKELLKKGRTRNLVTTIARALGVKTYGAPYSIETTIPKRLNSGGDVRGFNKGGNIERFGRNKTVVSGPSSIGYDDRYGDVPLKGFVLNQGASLDPRNKDLVAAAPSTFGSGGATMTAMLTPKETVFGPGIHKDPALYAAVEAANNGYAFGGNILPFKKNYGRLSGQLMKLIASGKGKDAILNYQDKILMQAGTARASAKTIDEMLGIPLPKGSTYDDLGHIITAKGKRIVGKIAKPASGVFGDKESFEKYNKLLSGAGLSGEDITGYLRGLVKFGGGKVVGSTSTLLRKLPSHIIDPKIVSEIEDAIHSQYIREVIRMKRLGIPLTDTNNPYHSISSKIIQERFDTNPALRDVWNQWKTKTSAVNKHYFSELTTGRGASTNGAMDIKVLDPITGEEINIGKLVGSDDSKFYHSGNEDWNENLVKLNMGGGIIDPKRKNYGVPQLGAKVINRLTKKWKPKEQFWPQGHQYTLGNQDPLHGPLQIGRTMVPKNMQDDPGWTREVIYKDDRFARQNVMQQFPIGTLEDRGKYILRQYMAGNYGLMEQPGAYEALKSLRQKFTGRLYRGIKLGKGKRGGMAPLPQHIIDAIESARLTGDASSLIGQEFVMRRSSWSESKNIASYFGSGYHVDPESVLIEAIVKNRNIIPAGRMFPHLKFPAPYGQKRDNLPEQEAIFGGKFRILGFSNGKLQVETVVDGARAMGGPVSSGRSYIVGEKGPEVFVPKANGSIVPNYALGGDIRYGKNSYGEQAPGMNMKRTMGMSLLSMIPGYAGYSVGSKLTGGSMLGGLAGGMAGDILGTTLLNKFMFSADGATKKVSLLTRAWQLFTKAPGPLKIVAAVVAVAGSIKLINDKIMEHRKIINLAFGQTADTAKKIGDGFQFKSLSQQLKEARNELKAFNDSMTIAGAGDKKMNLGQLMFKAEDIKKEIEKVKKDLPELVEVFNKAKPEEVLGKAEQLKAQFIAGGMSSENATKKIYALIAASNDASMALSTVASGGFQAITDKSSAANVSIATFNKLLGEGNTDQIYAAFETANISAQALEQSLIGTKNAQGEIIDEAGAYEEAYNRIANSAGANKEIGEETLRAFISQNKELEKVLNATDTLEGSFAKLKLYSLGIREDLATMNSDLAETLALIATQQAGILGSNTGPFKDLVNLIAKQDAAAKSSAATAKKLATATKDQIQSEIDKRRENIDAIKKEAEERKKALDQELSDSDRLIAIQKAQIEYQNALASGDFTTAAQAQLDIQSLVQEQQTELAKRAIDARADALIAPEDARIKALEDQLKGLDAQITSANNAASKTMDNVNKLRETLSGLITFTISATADGAIDASEAGVLRGIQTSLKNLGLNKLASGLGLQVTEYGRNMKGSPGPSDINNIYEYGVLKQGTDAFTAAFNSVKDGNNLNVKVKNLDELKNALSGGKTDTVNPAILLPGTAVQGTATGGLNAAAAKAKSGIFTYQGKQYNKDSTGTGFYGTGAEDRKFWYIKKADGGRIKHFGPGGGVNGPGTSTSDSIPAMLSDGEYVIKASSVNKYGAETFDALNAGRFAKGGSVGKLPTSLSLGDNRYLPVKPAGSIWQKPTSPEPKREDYKTEKEFYKAFYGRYNEKFFTPPEEDYPIDKIKSPMGSLQRFLDIARSQIGWNHAYQIHSNANPQGVESMDAPTKFSVWQNQQYKLGSDILNWCGAFVAWVAQNSGVTVSKNMFSAFKATKDYKEQGLFNDLTNKENFKNIKIGDIAWFDWNQDGWKRDGVADHAAIVSRKDKDGISTIGQYGIGKVRENRVNDNSQLFGSARPSFKAFANGGLVQRFAKGGQVGSAPHSLGMRSFGSNKKLSEIENMRLQSSSVSKFIEERQKQQARKNKNLSYYESKIDDPIKTYSDTFGKTFTRSPFGIFAPITALVSDLAGVYLQGKTPTFGKDGIAKTLKPTSYESDVSSLMQGMIHPYAEIAKGSATKGDWLNAGLSLVPGAGFASGANKARAAVMAAKAVETLPTAAKIKITPMGVLRSKFESLKQSADDISYQKSPEFERSRFELALKQAVSASKAKGFTSLMDLKSVDYSKLYKEHLNLKNFEEPVKIGSDSERYSFRFTKGDIPELATGSSGSSVGEYLKALKEKRTPSTEFPTSSSHLVEIIDNITGKRAAHITYDPISGFIHYRGTEKAYQKQGLSEFLYNKAASITRIRHSGNLTPQGHPSALRMGGFMAYDDVFGALDASVSGSVVKKYVELLKNRKIKTAKNKNNSSTPTISTGYREPSEIGWQEDRMLDLPEYAGIDLRPQTRDWFQNPFRTSSNFPYGPNEYVDPGAVSELRRIKELERQVAVRRREAKDAERARNEARQASDAAAALEQYNTLTAWRNNPNRTYNTYPFGYSGNVEPIDEADLLRLMKIGHDSPATWRWVNPYHNPNLPPVGSPVGGPVRPSSYDPLGNTSDSFAMGGLVKKFADGGPVGANKFNIGKPDPKQSILNNLIFGQKYVGGNSKILKNEIPFGPGGMSKIIAKLGYKPVNLFNQYMNYFKAKKMLKSGMFHGSADLGRNSDGPFSGVTNLSGDYARDPYYGMGFYGTSSKAEADLYAGGYNVPGQWGESYGSLNKITKIPFGKYLDFSKDLKNQNYGLWKLLGERGFMGAGENLGPLMNKAGMTGSIMPRISAGQTGDISMDMAKWIALNKPKGTVLKEVGMGFANGGMVGPKYNIPSTSSSIVNPQPMRYNNGGPVHKYDVGGLVVNAAPGQSEREIASMVVQMLDNKNMLEAAKSGGRNRT